MYTADVVIIVEHRSLSAHRYADDLQVCGRCHPIDSTSLCCHFDDCIKQVTSWMGTNHLPKFVWLVPPRQKHQFLFDHLVVSVVQVTPADSVRDFGIYLDSTVSMRSHVNKFICMCFGILWQILCARRSVPHLTLTVLTSIMSKLDYCNVALTGLPCCSVDQHCCTPHSWCTAVWPLHSTTRRASLTQMPQRIQYKLCVLAQQCVNGSAPTYLKNAICLFASAEPQRRLRLMSLADLVVSVTHRSTLGDHAFIVACPRA